MAFQEDKLFHPVSNIGFPDFPIPEFFDRNPSGFVNNFIANGIADLLPRLPRKACGTVWMYVVLVYSVR